MWSVIPRKGLHPRNPPKAATPLKSLPRDYRRRPDLVSWFGGAAQLGPSSVRRMAVMGVYREMELRVEADCLGHLALGSCRLHGVEDPKANTFCKGLVAGQRASRVQDWVAPYWRC